MAFPDILLIIIFTGVAGLFLAGFVMIIWTELSLEFRKRRELRELGKAKHRRENEIDG